MTEDNNSGIIRRIGVTVNSFSYQLRIPARTAFLISIVKFG